jgi:CBS domain-containing protein
MSLAALLTRKAITVSPNNTLCRAAELMEQHRVGTVVVTEKDRPIGIVTDRDLALAACVRRVSPDSPLRGVMTHPVSTIREDDSILSATQQMMERAVRRLPVVDKLEHVVGLVSLDDLLPLLSRELDNIAQGIRAELRVP